MPHEITQRARTYQRNSKLDVQRTISVALPPEVIERYWILHSLRIAAEGLERVKSDDPIGDRSTEACMGWVKTTSASRTLSSYLYREMDRAVSSRTSASLSRTSHSTRQSQRCAL